MRILHISDTHGEHNNITHLPPADIIIHSGDISMNGSCDEIDDFIEWFSSLDYKHKLFIGGNHDEALSERDAKDIQQCLPDNCHYLYNSGIVIEGIKFWGVPYFVIDNIDGTYQQAIEEIPRDIDVLITHCPPLGISAKEDDIEIVIAHV